MTMGRTVRALSLALAVLLVAAGVFLVPTIWGKPWSIEHYYTRVLIEFAIQHPMLLSYARVLEPYGLDFHSDDLEDFSVEAERRQLAQAKEFLEGLRRFDRGRQSESQLLSTDILEWYLQIQVDREPFLFHDYPVEQLQGLQSLLITFMVEIHQVAGERDARNYVRRLAGFGTAMDQIIERLRFRRERGVVPPRFVLEAVREEIQEFAGVPVVDNVLYTKLERDLGAVEGLEPGVRDELLRAAHRELDTTVLPAYRRLSDVLAELAAVATDDDGVWKLPDGDAYYRWALRFHTTTDLSPDEVHRLGLAEVERIHGEMRAILEELGHPTRDLMATLEALREEERFLYPESDAGRRQVLADFQAIIEEAAGQMGAYFGRLPRAQVVVKRVPEFKEEGSAGAYYDAPAFDGSRPGVFYVNLRNLREVAKFGMRTLAYHEAIPGHHFQIALSIEMEGVPFFRRVIPFTAFIEGWALYAEQLAAEQGFHPTPYDRLGQLMAENFRAVRLVVDTGIHAKRWTREQAIDYLLRHAGTPKTDAVAEVERYIVMPGQACAYKLGQLRILELRERARERLGDAFELREFHDLILGSGAMPLTILERVVDRWIDSRTSSAS
jgi:uncharacterized protein (DUF885 family)